MSLRQPLLEALPDAQILVRAPGRINLIGEHVDYNGFPVLPMAIAASIWIAVAPRRDGLLHIRNLDPGRFPEEMIGVPDLADRPRRGFWSDYVIAAARQLDLTDGAEIVVTSDLPVAAGLSSSAALVVGSLLALGAESLDVDRALLAHTAVEAEQYIGTAVGGMDQTVCARAEAGHALRIEFGPVRVTPVPLPAELCLLVVDSGVRAEKGGAAQDAYNDRVRTCAQAAAELGAPAGGRLADVPPARREDLKRLSSDLLRRRAGFVFAEADRVEAAMLAAAAGDLDRFGALLNASHRGLRDDYEVSHPDVDALVERATDAGALGARIVGAGFGGSMIVAARATEVERIQEALGGAAAVVTPGPGAERMRVQG